MAVSERAASESPVQSLQRDGDLHLAHRNRLVGWCLFLVGITGGMVLGLWAFEGPMPAPERFADYGGLPRRLLRLGHIAAMALGLTNIFFGIELPGLSLSPASKKVASICMIAGAALMPVILTLAAFQEPWKFLLPIPATSTFVAVALVCRGLWHFPGHDLTGSREVT